MTSLRPLLGPAAAAAACLALTGCIPAVPEPTSTPPVARPAARPSPAPAPTPAPTPAAMPQTWMDAPKTPGDWRYRELGGTTAAMFGTTQGDARFTLDCNRASRTISLIRPAEASDVVSMRVLTETRDRTLQARPTAQQPPSIAATLPANDPLLDAMAFSKGRFAVETAGLPTLYLPNWPEVTRVIEDCR